MSLHTIPAALQLFIQDKKEGVLLASLTPKLGFRQVAAKEPIGVGIGESVTKFRGSLLAPTSTPIAPGTFNADLDNGLTPDTRSGEQFTLTPALFARTMNLNLLNNVTSLIRDYGNNLIAQVQQSQASVDIIAQKKLQGAYFGGQTFATAAATSDTTIAVDDVTGFETKMVNGVPTAVSGSNALSITINGTANTVTGVAVDGTSTSRNPFGRSGTLTLGTARADVLGDIVVAADAPHIVRPRASGVERADNLAIVAGDLLTLRQLRDASTTLKNNGVPTINGAYNVYLSQDSMDLLFLDSEFKQIFQGTGTTEEVYTTGTVYRMMDLRFITNNQMRTIAAGASPTSVKLGMAIMVGDEALLEGEFINQQVLAEQAGGMETALRLHNVSVMDGINFVDRAALDRLGLNFTQSWFYIGDFCVPTDSLITSAVLPTANSSRLKRAVAMPHAMS